MRRRILKQSAHAPGLGYRSRVVAVIGCQQYLASAAWDRLGRCSPRFYQIRQVPDVRARSHHEHTLRLALPASGADGDLHDQDLGRYRTQIDGGKAMAIAAQRPHKLVKVWEPPATGATPLGPPPT